MVLAGEHVRCEKAERHAGAELLAKSRGWQDQTFRDLVAVGPPQKPPAWPEVDVDQRTG